ncbi:MAG: NFACT family protein [Desulfuromonas sp.]
MTLDCFFLEALITQLRQRIGSGQIRKIHQPTADLLVLRLWTGQQECQLLLSLMPGSAGLWLTDRRFRNPAVPAGFCQLLRARLQRILKLELYDQDRRVVLHGQATDGRRCRLLLELFGRRPVLLLLDDDDRILGRLPTAGQPSAGSIWPVPLSAAIALPQAVAAIAAGAVSLLDETLLARWLQQQVRPMSRLVAGRLAGQMVAQAALEPLQQFVAAWQQQRWQLQITDRVLSLWPAEGSVEPLPDLSALLDQRQRLETAASGRVLVDEPVQTAVHQALQRLQRRLAEIDRQEAEAEQAEDWQQTAELLNGHRHLLRPGLAAIELPDYYRQPPCPRRILLDPALSPQQNIEGWFRRARKARRGLEHARRRREETRELLSWLETLQHELETADTALDSELVRQELMTAGLFRPVKTRFERARPPAPAQALQSARTPGGLELLWGRNSRTNDYLSRQLLRPDDLWLHALGVPGCHLVIRTGGAVVADSDVLYAAQIAAYYSRARDAGRVEVMVAQGRAVRTLPGGRPGQVRVTAYRSLRVVPTPPAATVGTTLPPA